MHKNILVTGVSQGVGYAITSAILEQGWTVYGISRHRTSQLETLINKHGDNLKWIPYDLANLKDVDDELLKRQITLDNPLHGLVNNAAHAYDDLVTNLNLDSLQKMYAVNVFAPMILTKYCIRNMILHKTEGSIVHLSSVSVHTGYKGLSMYAATKGSLEAFSKNIAREWGERNIRSNCIVAGFMGTMMSSGLNEEQKRKISQRTALKKETSIHSVADTAVFLLSDKASSITGQNIFVDSGTI